MPVSSSTIAITIHESKDANALVHDQMHHIYYKSIGDLYPYAYFAHLIITGSTIIVPVVLELAQAQPFVSTRAGIHCLHLSREI